MARIIIFLVILYLGMRINSFITSSICFIRGSIGIPCPLCGMTRALKLFVKGDFHGAFNMHPLFIVPIILLIFIAIKGFESLKKHKYKISILFIAIYLYRMIVMFPTTSPLTFNNLAILPRLLNIIIYIFNSITKGII